MAKHFVGFGQTSNILRLKLIDSSSSVGAGLTGLTSSSAGLKICTICDNEATTTAYNQAASNIEGITTLGTFAAPTAGKCRFKEVDATNHPGVYEVQLPDARYAVAGAKRLVVSIFGATNLAQADFEIELGMPVGAIGAGAFASDGVASAATSTTITLQSGQSYATNSLAGRIVQIVGGTGAGQIGVVKSNTNASPSVLTFWNAFVTTPDTTSQYVFGSLGDVFRAVDVETAGNLSAQEVLSIILSGVAGEWTASGTFKTPNGSATRISGTAAGTAPFRSSITLTPSS